MAGRGASEVHVLRTRLRAAFARAKTLEGGDPEMVSDFAKYLCVLVSGFVETAVGELAVEHCRARSHKTVLSFSTSHLDRIQNLNAEKLTQFIRSFDSGWALRLVEFMEGQRKDALDSVIGLRNQIAHGQSVGLSLARITQYFDKVDELVVFVEKLMK